MYDGSVPVIYKGTLGNNNILKAENINAYFNQVAIIDSNTLAFRAKNTKENIQILGKANLNKPFTLVLNDHILSQKNDGIFGSDGQLLVNRWKKELIYVHYYRNQILGINENLKLLYQDKTIDTITVAKVQTKELSNGTIKFSTPPKQVNLYAATHKNLLFVNSNLRGYYEPAKQWDNSSAVDIYDISQHNYIGSFYINKKKNQNIRQMIATDQYLFVLNDQEMVRYQFARLITSHFLKGEAEKP